MPDSRRCEAMLEILVIIPTVPRGNDPSAWTLTKTLHELSRRAGPAATPKADVLVVNGAEPADSHAECTGIVDRLERGEPSGLPVHVKSAVAERTRFERQVAARAHLTERALSPWHRWAAGYCLDYALALRLARRSDAAYLLVIEDDVRPADGWVGKVLRTAAPRLQRWPHPSFVALYSADLSARYEAGACAILYPNDERIDALADYIERRWDRGPLDHLLRDFAHEQRRPAFVLVPSLFEHVGDTSTQLPARPNDAPAIRRSATFEAERDAAGASMLERARIRTLRGKWWVQASWLRWRSARSRP
ncbi:MAG TPA: hypothetical protein VEL28_13510 [Candidatus Binatia bacterium]|nr:hypothetical protein [Candidatus Binatia bacterium]